MLRAPTSSRQKLRHICAAMSLSACGLLRAETPAKSEPALPLPLLAEAAPASAPASSRSASAAPPPPPAPAGASAPPGTDLLPAPGAAPRPTASLSENVTINLINRLVQRGALTQQDATDLIRLAEQDAQVARGQAQALAETQAVVQQQAAAAVPPVMADEYRVTYVPDMVKDQIRDQLKDEVLAQARKENWAAPNEIPEWTKRIKVLGDIRTQYQGYFFPSGNDVTGVFPNFPAINAGLPYNIGTNNAVPPPYLDVNQNRNRYLLRARIGFDIQLEDGFSAGFRMATGQTNSPVSTNQVVGAVGGLGSNVGTGGNFSLYPIWMDRAFIKYQTSADPNNNLSFFFGRFENPFSTSSELMWDEDVGFDGIAMKARYQPNEGGTTFFATGGAFPIFNTDLNFPNNSPSKQSSTDKYMYAAQVGIEFKPADKVEAKFAAAYYYFQNVSGQLSTPMDTPNANVVGSTDNRRPSFAQKGNTYMALRNITPDASNNNGTTDQYQYYGLASSFRNLTLNGRVDFNYYQTLQVSLLGEFVDNLAFNKSAINAIAVNNRDGGTGNFNGSGTAWYLGVRTGSPALQKRGDWFTTLSYRYIGSDSVIDAFTDSNFGGGGTNMQGYTLAAAMALSKSTRLGVSWMSANQITGPTFKADVFMFDLSVRF